MLLAECLEAGPGNFSSDLTMCLLTRRLDFGSYNDRGPYHGWIFAYAQISLSLTSVFCVTPNGNVRVRQLVSRLTHSEGFCCRT